jgi:P27 family predicted phage terminase small subunit
MSKPGRKRTPTAIKIHRGNPSKENLAAQIASEPAPPPAGLEPPALLQGAALEIWHRRAKQLSEMGVFAAPDRETLERYCLTYELFLEAYREVKANGLAATIGSGRRVGNPEVVALRGFAADLLKIEQEFGCTPSSRAGLVANHAQEVDPFDQFLRETS